MLKAGLKSGPVWALGAMSGTSLDGVDAAMVQTDGETIFAFGDSAYRAYSPTEEAVLRDALGKWPDEVGQEVLPLVQQAHIDALSRFQGAQIVGYHGQTLAHEPQGRGTHQLGDGEALAMHLGLPVIWDFRSADVRLGARARRSPRSSTSPAPSGWGPTARWRSSTSAAWATSPGSTPAATAPIRTARFWL